MAERRLGTLELGKEADLAVLAQDASLAALNNFPVHCSNALHHFGAVSRRTNPTTRDRLHLANSERPHLSQFWSRHQ